MLERCWSDAGAVPEQPKQPQNSKLGTAGRDHSQRSVHRDERIVETLELITEAHLDSPQETNLLSLPDPHLPQSPAVSCEHFGSADETLSCTHCWLMMLQNHPPANQQPLLGPATLERALSMALSRLMQSR